MGRGLFCSLVGVPGWVHGFGNIRFALDVTSEQDYLWTIFGCCDHGIDSDDTASVFRASLEVSGWCYSGRRLILPTFTKTSEAFLS